MFRKPYTIWRRSKCSNSNGKWVRFDDRRHYSKAVAEKEAESLAKVYNKPMRVHDGIKFVTEFYFERVYPSSQAAMDLHRREIK